MVDPTPQSTNILTQIPWEVYLLFTWGITFLLLLYLFNHYINLRKGDEWDPDVYFRSPVYREIQIQSSYISEIVRQLSRTNTVLNKVKTVRSLLSELLSARLGIPLDTFILIRSDYNRLLTIIQEKNLAIFLNAPELWLNAFPHKRKFLGIFPGEEYISKELIEGLTSQINTVSNLTITYGEYDDIRSN